MDEFPAQDFDSAEEESAEEGSENKELEFAPEAMDEFQAQDFDSAEEESAEEDSENKELEFEPEAMDEFPAQDFDSAEEESAKEDSEEDSAKNKELEFAPAQPRHMPPAKKLRSDAAAGERIRPSAAYPPKPMRAAVRPRSTSNWASRPSRAAAPTVAKDPPMPKPPSHAPPAYLVMTATGRSGAAKPTMASPAAHQAAERAKEQPGPEGWYDKRGEPWRPGRGGGQPRYGSSGGQHRDYYRKAARAMKKGRAEHAQFIETNPRPKELQKAWEFWKYWQDHMTILRPSRAH